MKFWTMLLITYGAGHFDGFQTVIPMESVEECSKAINPIYESIIDANPDMMVQCIETKIPYSSPRPRPNPFRTGDTND